ncbi:unnamed protein product [Sphagnum balticum]
MSKQKEVQLTDIGKKLAKPSQPKDALLKLLRQAASLLAEVEQSPQPSTVTALKGCSESLVLVNLLRHKDKDVKLLVALCISEIMRILAPDAPYSDECLKEIFHLIVSVFRGLNDINSPSFARRVNILETVAKVRSCVVMLDLECDELILEMFHTFFDTASDEHPQNVFLAMRSVLTLVLEESEEIPPAILEVILKNLLKKEVSTAAHKLAVSVVEKCVDKLEPYVQRFLTSVMLEGKSLKSGLHCDCHEIIYEIYCCAPQMLLAVIPNLTQELLTDQVDVRLKAVQLLGRLFALPGRHVAQEYRLLFSEFLKRFGDKAVEVRIAVVRCAKVCLEANPSGLEASEILASLEDRLLDFDDKVRMTVVKALCDLVKVNLKWVPTHILRKVADRLRDKKVFVRKDTLQKLTEVYKIYCTKCIDGSVTLDKQFEWIPSKIVRCCYDKDCKDFKPQGMEIVFTEELFEADLSVEERAKHWIALFSNFDENDRKALQYILLQKQRLQQEMQVFLSTRQKAKEEDAPELQKKIQSSLKIVANQFVDPVKAEDFLHKLYQMKDNSIFKSLAVLLNYSTTISQAVTAREELLKRIGEKHPQYDFMMVLATKCSYLLFGREHVRAILKEISAFKSSESKDLAATSLDLLVDVATYCPALMEDTEGDLMLLLKDTDESIKEGVVHIISKAGASFREQADDSILSSNVNLTLEQLCMEGNRKQAKYAVSAIATLTADSGLKALSVLYGRLVDQLEDSAHLPTVLQSLGCIAQNANPIFETREEEVIKFVVRNVLRRSIEQDLTIVFSEAFLASCFTFQEYAIKALVKSFLPKGNSYQRNRLPGLLKVLVKILNVGEISEDIKSSEVDKAHLRLAAAKGILRLARRWDTQIPVDIFQMVLLVLQDPVVHVRQLLLLKLHQYLKDRSLPLKFASGFALCAVDPVRENIQEARRCLADYIDVHRKEARKSVTTQMEGTSITLHPEYLLTYLVHVLAHHPRFPVTSSEHAHPLADDYFFRELLFIIWALVHQEEGRAEGGKKEDLDNLPAILAILRSIKNAEDLVDNSKTDRLYAICDIAIMIAKEVGRKKMFSGDYTRDIPLPATLYKVPAAVGGNATAVKSKCKISLLFSSTNSSVIAHAICQPTSPQGQKRGKRTSDGESVSEDEEAIEDGEPNSKRGKHEDEKLTKGTIGGTRGRRRSIDKNGSVKKPGKKPRISDSEDDSSKDQEVNLSLKQKQGSPVNMGTPSGQELAAPSISATKVKNRKTAEQSTQEFVQKRSVHEAKAKQVEKNEQDGQDGGLVEAGQRLVGTQRSAKKSTLVVEKGKKKAMAGSKAAAQQDRISGLPQQVFLSFCMQFPMRFIRGSGVHGAKLFFQDLGFYFNLRLYKTAIEAYLLFFWDHVSRKGKPSAKANKDSDPQKAGKGTWEIKSADSKNSPSELDGDDVIGDKDAAKQLQKDLSENINKAVGDKDAENSVVENAQEESVMVSGRLDPRNMAVGAAADDNQPVVRLLS